MFKRFSYTLVCISILVLQACGGDNAQNGSLTVRADLSISDITIAGATPAFSPDRVGLYELEVASEVESVDISFGQLSEESGVEIFVLRRTRLADSNSQLVSPGSTITMPLDEGDNLIRVRVRTTDEEQFRDYSFNVRRISTSVELGNISFGALSEEVDSGVDFVSPESFDAEVTEYSFNLPYSRCTVIMSTFARESGAEVFFDGESLGRGANLFLDFPVGETVHQLEVRAEDGIGSRLYTLTFNRDAPTAEDESFDVSLSDLVVAPGELTSTRGEGFNCFYGSYTTRVDNEQTSVAISATPSVAGREVSAARLVAVVDEDGAEGFEIEEWFVIPSGESVEFDVEVGDENNFVVAQRDPDTGDALFAYNINVTRAETNRTIVETGAELQQALLNAEPSDEIFILSTEALTGVATLAASGKDGVVFYSEASGTEEQPIVLINASSAAVLSPSAGHESATVFELAGDHWEIANLVIEGGSTGFVLNGASHNFIRFLDVSGSSDTGVQVLNGSHNNGFADLSISDLDGRALVVGSDASTWTSAPTPGPYAPANDNNAFGTFSIGPRVADTLIHIEEGATNTDLRSAQIHIDGYAGDKGNGAIIEIQGNETELSFSDFEDGTRDSPATIVRVSDAGKEWLTEQWGENTQVFDSQLDLSGLSDIALLTASDNVSQVSVANNVRTDAGSVVYSGVAVDDNFNRPAYQIQWIDFDNIDPDLNDIAANTFCLRRAPVTSSLNTTLGSVVREIVGVVTASCDASDSDQHWDLQNDGDGFVFLTDPEASVLTAPFYQGAMINFGTDGIAAFDAEAFSGSNAFFLRWTLEARENEAVVFSNKFARNFVLTMDGARLITYAIDSNTGRISAAGTFVSESEDEQLLYSERASSATQSNFSLLPLP